MKKYRLAGFYINSFAGLGEKEFSLLVLCVDYIAEYLFVFWLISLLSDVNIDEHRDFVLFPVLFSTFRAVASIEWWIFVEWINNCNL